MTLIIVITTFVAAFVQGVSGFGFALVAMPILSGVTSIQTAAPLVALTTLTNNLILCIYYRQSFDRNVIANLLLGSVLGIPIGFLALDYIPTALMLIVLGIVIVTYSLYSLISPVVPVLKSKLWAYGAGFLSGILLGSFNLPGPPVILYGSSQRWSQEKFKGNLTSFFWVSVAIVVVGHGFQNRISEEIIRQFLIAIPGFMLGLFLGVVLAKKFDPNIFRRVITVLLLVIGVRLIISGIYL
ncbi:MAG: sulfite exporter TauE/SafE family protein [Cyanobacteria bacterium P01_B01_bin.77]